MAGFKQRAWVKGLRVLGIIWLIGVMGDRLWFALDHSVPNWDQADYLTGALNYWQALKTAHWLSPDWWTRLWQLSTKIPPLVYLSTTPVLSLLGTGFDQSTVINLFYNVVLLGSVYALGVTLFSVSVGLWAAGLCLLMPGLYRVRLDYLIDYPLAAMVTLCFACLTLWREEGEGKGEREKGEGEAIPGNEPITNPPSSSILHPSSLIPHPSWLLAIASGITFGLALLVKQPALLFLLVPIIWIGVETVWQRRWGRLAQIAVALAVALLVFLPWYRTNWLLMLSSSKRATVDSAISEGDPSLLSLDAWTYYLKVLPGMVSLPLLLLGIAGFLLFWRRSRVSCHYLAEADYAPKPKDYSQQTYAASRQSLGWLLVFCLSSYLLSSLNINKDARYVVPYLPVVAVILAYGFWLLPKRWQLFRWGAVGLAGVLMIYNIFPIKPDFGLHNPLAHRPAYVGANYPHAEIIAEVIKTDPYLRSTIGVLPSTAEVNQHNINYYGNLRNFQVYGRQVGTRLKQVAQDGRSLSWFITKTDDQGSIRKREAQMAIAQLVEQSGDFKLHKTWKLPDSSILKLFRRRIPLVEVGSVVGLGEGRGVEGVGGIEGVKMKLKTQNSKLKTQNSLTLDQIILPNQAPPGKPVPVTYRWSGTREALQNGLMLLTWRRQDKSEKRSDRWFHDHAIGMGSLYLTNPPVPQTFPASPRPRVPASSPSPSSSPSQLPASPHPRVPASSDNSRYEVIERTAMLPPTNAAPGIYTLEATYLNRQTQATTPIALPKVSLRIDPKAAATNAPELDLNTQLRSLAEMLPQGMKALDAAFAEIGRINQYDPTQDYVDQTQQAMAYRLQQEPRNRDFAYTLALANVLKRQVNPAIATLQQVTQLDPKNPNAYAYLAFVNLYDFRPKAAQQAINTALKLNPNLPELQALNGVAALMRGNLVQAQQSAREYLRRAKKISVQ